MPSPPERECHYCKLPIPDSEKPKVLRHQDAMRTAAEDSQVTQLLREYDEAVAEEQDAASRAAAAADELLQLGVDVEKIR